MSPGALPQAVGGGDISDAWRVDGPAAAVFLKTGPAEFREIFDAEVDGLLALAGSGAIRVPEVLGTGDTGPLAWLALEWLEFQGSTPATDAALGQQLARMHRHTYEHFGWHRDNRIGATPQRNATSGDWTDFYAEQRLGFQLRTAARYGYGGELQELGAALIESLPMLFAEHRPEASLLHGDLWGGNHAVTDGQPVLFDPAVYAGDRETDLAMTRLFGGFSPGFYRAYEQEWPLPAGHEQRVGIYQLYHVLNHLNLFGQSYLGRSLALIRETLATIPGSSSP